MTHYVHRGVGYCALNVAVQFLCTSHCACQCGQLTADFSEIYQCSQLAHRHLFTFTREEMVSSYIHT